MQEAVLHYMPFSLKMTREREDCAEAARFRSRPAAVEPERGREGDRRSPPRGQGRNSADRQAVCFGPVPSRPLSSLDSLAT
jgi:hypothetical protein